MSLTSLFLTEGIMQGLHVGGYYANKNSALGKLYGKYMKLSPMARFGIGLTEDVVTGFINADKSKGTFNTIKDIAVYGGASSALGLVTDHILHHHGQEIKRQFLSAKPMGPYLKTAGRREIRNVARKFSNMPRGGKLGLMAGAGAYLGVMASGDNNFSGTAKDAIIGAGLGAGAFAIGDAFWQKHGKAVKNYIRESHVPLDPEPKVRKRMMLGPDGKRKRMEDPEDLKKHAKWKERQQRRKNKDKVRIKNKTRFPKAGPQPHRVNGYDISFAKDHKHQAFLDRIIGETIGLREAKDLSKAHGAIDMYRDPLKIMRDAGEISEEHYNVVTRHLDSHQEKIKLVNLHNTTQWSSDINVKEPIYSAEHRAYINEHGQVVEEKTGRVLHEGEHPVHDRKVTVGEVGKTDAKNAGKAINEKVAMRDARKLSSAMKLGGKFALAAIGAASLLDITNKMHRDDKVDKEKAKQEERILKQENQDKSNIRQMFGYNYVNFGDVVTEMWNQRIGHYKMGNAKF